MTLNDRTNDEVFDLIRALQPIASKHRFALFYDADSSGSKGWLIQAVDISKADPSWSFDDDMLVATEENKNSPPPLGVHVTDGIAGKDKPGG